MKVLMIDDDPGAVEVVSLALQRHWPEWPEAELVSTGLGEKGVEMVKSEAPDIVILDLGLPDVDGFAVLNQVRLFSNVPIVILSVRGEKSDIVKGLELGADDYMVKPFRALELMARMRALMRRPRSKKPLGEVYGGEMMLNEYDAKRLQEFVDRCVPVTDGYLLPLSMAERHELSDIVLKCMEGLGITTSEPG